MKVKSFLMLSVVVFLWSSSFTILKLGLEDMPPITLAFLRFLLVVPFFVAFTYSRDRGAFTRSIVKNWKSFSLLGLAGVTSYHVFQNVGLEFTTASNSSLIIASNPIFIALLSYLYLKEQLNLRQVLGIVLAFLGITVVITRQGPLMLAANPFGAVGDLMSLGAALSWAFYSVFGKDALSSHDARDVTTITMVFGTLFLFPLAFAFEKPVLPTSAWIWFLLLVLSFLCSGVGYLFWFKALEDIPASKAGFFLFFLPVLSVLIAHLVLLEPLDVPFGVGAALVILGTTITERS